MQALVNSLMEEAVFTLPGKFVQASCGFALDVGGSLAKFVYRSKEDYKEGKPLKDFGVTKTGERLGRVRIVKVSPLQLHLVKDQINTWVDLTPHGGVLTAHTTGFAGGELKDALTKEHNVRFESEFEMDSFVRAFCLLRECISPDEFHLSLPFISSQDEVDVHWPTLLTMTGSGFAFLKIQEDGKYTFIEGPWKGGRCFLGLIRMMTDLPFEDFMARAEKGDGTTTDLQVSEQNPGVGGRDVEVVPFGKVATCDKASIKPEDSAHSLLYLFCENLAHITFLTARRTGCARIHFVGNFVNHPKTQNLIATQLEARNATLGPDEHPLHFYFVRHGGLFGALGAFMADWTKQNQE